jgi:hypothetical protein
MPVTVGRIGSLRIDTRGSTTSTPTPRCPPAHTRCGWSSTTARLGKGGSATLYLDGVKCGEGAIDATAATILSADDTCDVGVENGALVADDYPVPNTFTGDVNWVQIDVDQAADDADHRIDPDERSGWPWRGSRRRESMTYG